MCEHVSSEPLTDDFNDGVLGPAWKVVTQSGGASWDESAGTLNVGGSSGQTGELVLQYNHALADVGSVRVDYDWVVCDDHKARVGLGLYDSYENDLTHGNGFLIKGVKHASGCRQHAVDGNHHVVGGDGAYQYVEPVAEIGSFMIERNGNDFRVRYLDGGVWQNLIEAQHNFGETPIYPYLFTSNSHENPNWRVALDNFSADVTIPSYASFDDSTNLDVLEIDFGTLLAGTPEPSVTFSITNLKQSEPDTDSVVTLDSFTASGDAHILKTDLHSFGLLPGESKDFAASMHTEMSGSYSTNTILNFSDGRGREQTSIDRLVSLGGRSVH